MGTRHALVVHGTDGVDEMSLSAPSMVWEVRAGEQPRSYEITPESLGLERAGRETILGGSVAENVATVRTVLDGSTIGPKRAIVLLNAAAALVASEQAANFDEGISLGRQALDSGAAYERMERMVQASQA
jgi:anthranilate phosphoribosyltransferase